MSITLIILIGFGLPEIYLFFLVGLSLPEVIPDPDCLAALRLAPNRSIFSAKPFLFRLESERVIDCFVVPLHVKN